MPKSDISRQSIYLMGTAIALLTFILSAIGLITGDADPYDEMPDKLLSRLTVRLLGSLLLSNYCALPYYLALKAVRRTCWPHVFIIACIITFFFDVYVRIMISLIPGIPVYPQIPLYSPALISFVLVVFWLLMPLDEAGRR